MSPLLTPVAVAAMIALVAGCAPVAPPPATPGSASSASEPTSSPGASSGPVAAAQWGMLFYYPDSPTAGTAPLVAWRPGEVQTRAMLTLDAYSAHHTSSISVDGSRIAFVPGAPQENSSGPLVVANMDGSGRRTLQDKILAECAPTWSPDGGQLAMVRLTGDEATTGFVDVATGAFTVGIVDWGCHRAWSGDGRSMAHCTAPAGDLWISPPGASGSLRQVPGIGESTGGARRAADVMSLSADGRLVAVNVRYNAEPDTDALRRMVKANEIVNTATGKAIPLPVGGELEQAYFLPTGGGVLRMKNGSRHTVALISADLAVVATVDEPAALSGSVLLGAGTR